MYLPVNCILGYAIIIPINTACVNISFGNLYERKYFETLRNAQIKLMVEIITGEKSADVYQAEFEKLWNEYGGKTLEGETVQVAENIEKILSELGVQ